MRRLRFVLACAGIGGVAATMTAARGATIRFDNGNSTNVWEDATNWIGDVLPSNNDVAELNANNNPNVNGNLTVSISSAQTVDEVTVHNPNGSGTFIVGDTTRLNILTGTDLLVETTNGVRVGRTLRAGQAFGSQFGQVFQTGGAVRAGRVSLSPETSSADSYYRISDGALVGLVTANLTDAATGNLRIGVTTSGYSRAEFHVMGSAVDQIRFLDVEIADGTVASGGRAVVHFSLDAGGVTPITAEDEFQFRGTSGGIGLLEVDLIAPPPTTDIPLVVSDRLGANGGASELFSNYADGATLVAAGAGWEYTYTVDYIDGGDDGTLEPSIVLRYVSSEAIPEPASLALVALGGLTMLRRRRFRKSSGGPA